MKKLRVFVSVVLVLCFLVGCTQSLTSNVELDKATEIYPERLKTETVKASSTKTATSTLTPTKVSTPTNTSTPTVVPTPTDTPTPTEILPVEWDLDPYIEKAIEQEWEGVKIKARLLVDSSLEDEIESVDMSDELFAEIIARTIWLVWYARQGNTDWYVAKPAEVHPFMEMWAKAQKTGNYSDWRRVQLDDIWANDLTDGDGYVQESYDFWPMYEGETPYGVTAVNRITLVLLNASDIKNIKNITRYSLSSLDPEVMSSGWGSNLNNGDLLIYLGHSYEPTIYSHPDITSFSVLCLELTAGSTWLILNTGSSDIPFDISADTYIYNKLIFGGLKVTFKFE